MSNPAITPGARIAMRLCTCGHRAGLHDQYMRGPCRAHTGLGRAAKRCRCVKFTPEQSTNQ